MRWKPPLAAVSTLLAAACASGPPATDGMSFSADPLIGKVVWRDLVTEDIAAASAFYSGLFGWTFESSSGPEGRPYALARDGDVYVAGLVEADSTDGVNESRWLPYISVSDVDRAVGQATEAGGRVAVAPRDVRYGRVAALIDPEGAVVGVARSDIGDPDDRTTAPAPGRAVWTELIADDPAAEARFYERVIGYESRTVARRGGQYTMLEAGGRQRAGVLANPSSDWDPVWLTYFQVDDVDAASTRAQSLGGTVILAASPDLREGTMALIADPSGAILVLQRSLAQ